MKLFRSILLLLLCAIVGAVVLHADTEDTESTEGTLPGEIRVYIYKDRTGTEFEGVNNIYTTLGDTLTLDVFLRNFKQEAITGLDLYLTVPSEYFQIVSQGMNTDEYENHPQPFIKGEFLGQAQGYLPLPKGNWMHGDSLTAEDNGLVGWQLDYVELSPAVPGGDRPSTRLRYGIAAKFQIIAIAPCDSIGITLDIDSYNSRVSRYKQLGTGESFYYKSFQPCYITATGAMINPPLPDIQMEPASVDSSLDLDEHIGVSSIPDSLFVWRAEGQNRIDVAIDSVTHRVEFTSPSDFHGAEEITFTVGTTSTPDIDSDTMRVLVDDPPVLNRAAIPDTLTIYEDSLTTVFHLPSIVSDVDDDFSTLIWTFTTGENLSAYRIGALSDTLKLQGAPNYYGLESLKMSVYDAYGLGDSLDVPVKVLPLNDAPTLTGLPDVTFERTESYEFDLSLYAEDVDNDPLQVTWSDPDSFFIVASGMNITITEAEGFLGTREVIFTVQDPSGLADSDTMLVTVTPRSDPPVWSPIPKIGFAQDGMFSDLILWDYVEDPDGTDRELRFTFSGYDDVDSIRVDPNDGRLYMYDLDDRPGWDWVYVTARDYDDNTATTRFLVFVAPKDGTPIVGAIPDTTMRAGRPFDWIDLDDYYYDIDNTDSQMRWTWSHNYPDTLVYADIHNLFRSVTLYTYNPDSTGIDNLRFTVTDPDDKTAYDDCLITVLGETRPLLDMPPKVGFIAGEREVIDLDDYTEDPVYNKDELTWKWWGNTDIEAGYSDTDTTLSRPFYFTSDSTYIGWEKMFFEVRNPLSGTAADSTIVFSVSGDGSPLAGGLEYIYIHAGYCDSMNIDLDNFYYDADSFDWGVNWEVSGNDSVLVSIDPITHRAQFCSPSETFEGQEMITLTVSDGISESSMDVAIIVYGAVYRNVFTMDVFRNPMQGDYMDLYLESSKELFGTPKVEVRVDRTGVPDTTFVNMGILVEGGSYYHGRYLLPYEASLGIQRDAVVIATGITKNNKAVEDTLVFAYGRLGTSGGKLALGPVSLDIPSGALKTTATVTIIPDRGSTVEGAAKPAESELIPSGMPYTVGPAGLVTGLPMQVTFDLCCRADGAGIYRAQGDIWEYVPGVSTDDRIFADVVTTGTYRVAFDRTPPAVTLAETSGDVISFTLSDHGSGIDPASLAVSWEQGVLHPVYDDDADRYSISIPGYHDAGPVTLSVTVADRVGNVRKAALDTSIESVPGAFAVWQNVPNPFNPRTVIPFTVPAEGRVRIEIYDVLGRLVVILADGAYPAGTHRLTWDACDTGGRQVSSGIYLYRVSAGDAVRTRKMMLMR